MTDHRTRVLVVDDTPFDRELLHAHLSEAGYAIELASDGAEAWDLLQGNLTRFDVVLVDRSMPRMGGLELLEKIKDHDRLRALPVIMQTAASSREEMLEGLAAGAYYYLTKPYDSKTLLAVVGTAVRDFSSYRELQEELQRGARSLSLLQSARFSVRTISDARDIGTLLATICPDPMNAVIGLTELLVNAVEHGNLGITYGEKSSLNASGMWEAEVERRLLEPENSAKRAIIEVDRDDREIRFTIRDEGPGFDWVRYFEADPGRAFDNHGRGIVIARSISFDRLEYRGNGNEVVASVTLD